MRACYICTFVATTLLPPTSILFFFNDTATTEIYTLSLHDALPISRTQGKIKNLVFATTQFNLCSRSRSVHPIHASRSRSAHRSEEHTSELQSRSDLVCRLLLEKKKKNNTQTLQPPPQSASTRHTHH